MTSPGFNESAVVPRRELLLEKAFLVVGVPGVGLVSKLAVDQLIRATKAERIATLYSPHYPNQTLALQKGKLKAFTTDFFYSRVNGFDLVFMKSDLQPLTVEGQYEVAAKAVEYFKSIGGRTVFSFAGYAVPGVKKPAVIASSTSKKLFEALSDYGAKKPPVKVIPIVGLAGLMPSVARVHGLHGACLLVETTGAPLDARAAKKAVSFLSEIVGEKIDVKGIDERARNAERVLNQLRSQQKPQPAITPSGAPATSDDNLSYIH